MTRLERLVASLQKFYGALPSPPTDPFGMFVWEVLSTHSTPRKRDAAMNALRRHRALTPDAMARLPQKKFEESVALAGPYVEQRLRALRVGVDLFRRTPALPHTIRGPLVSARRALNRLPQMADGGACRMLLFAADHPIMPVDTRLIRVTRRLGYVAAVDGSRARTVRRIRDAAADDLQGNVEAYRRAYAYLDHHGAATCTENDPHCTVCPLVGECPEGGRRLGALD
jgi:endonuclease III